jgi:WD40 repeat protein
MPWRKKMPRLPITLALLFLLLPAGFGQNTLQPLTHHNSAVVGIQQHPERPWIISVSDRGGLRVWDSTTYDLIQSLRLTPWKVERFVLHPQKPEIAILIQDAQGSFQITAFDYQSEEEIFTLALDQEPLFLSYSLGGQYLFYTVFDSPSLRLVSAENGDPRGRLDRMPGIHSFGYIGSSERTYMGYTPSGEIFYYDINTGAQKLNVRLPGGLSDLAVLEDIRYLMAKDDQDVLIIDRTTGEIQSRTTIPGLFELYLSHDKRHILARLTDDQYKLLRVNGTRLSSQYYDLRSGHRESFTTYFVKGGLVFAGNRNGKIQYRNFNADRWHVFAEDFVNNIHNFLILKDGALLAGKDSAVYIQTRFFHTQNPSDLNNLVYKNIELPGQAIYLEYDEEAGTAYIFIDDNAGVVYLYSSEDFSTWTPLLQINDQVIKTGLQDGKLYYLTDGGDLFQYDPEQGQTQLTFGLAANDFTITEEKFILSTTRSAETTLITSVAVLDQQTRELIYYPSGQFLTFKVISTGKANEFYVMGISEDKSNTQLLRYDNAGQYNIIDQIPNEYLGAELVYQENTQTVFYSFDKLNFIAIKNGRRSNTSNYRIFPDRLTSLDNGNLVSIDHLGSLVLWSNQAPTGRFVLLDGENWAYLDIKNPEIIGSPGARQYIGSGYIQ